MSKKFKNTKQRLYVAYGSNLNKAQMKFRCPTAKLVGTGIIKDYELQFKGSPHSAFATVAPKKGSSVPIALWDIKAMDEYRLDLYEGYPKHYFKRDVPIVVDGKEIRAMAYIMNLECKFGVPSDHYYDVVHRGYVDCGLDTDVLEKALDTSTEQYYKNIYADMSPFECLDNKYDEDSSDEDEDESEDAGWQMTF